MNFNTLLKELREEKFGVKYPCACKFQCEYFGGNKECDNCPRCGSDNPDQHKSESDIKHYEKTYA